MEALPQKLPPLKEREKRILYFIRMWQWRERYSPSLGDIGFSFGVHKQTIAQIVTSLRRKGYIELSNQKNWRHRKILFPHGTVFPWGVDPRLPDELFDHMRPENIAKREERERQKMLKKVNGNSEEHPV